MSGTTKKNKPVTKHTKYGPDSQNLQRGLAKLNPPKLRSPIIRNRLIERLDCGKTVTWVSGPPGIGKTTLIASYFSAKNIKPMWMQLDADDQLPTTFFHFLRMAITAVGGPEASLPDASDRHDWPRFARQFARQVIGKAGCPTHWVFDNIQNVANSPIEEIIAALADEASDDIRFYVLSHHAPPAAFIGLIGEQRVYRMESTSIAFSADETNTLVMQLNPAEAKSSAEIFALTKGWPAAIVLLSAQKIGADSAINFNPDEAQALFTFFALQVYERLPTDVRQVLDHCAWLPEFNAETAASASGIKNAGDLLRKLEQDGFFIELHAATAEPIDNEQGYQIHQLFSAFLRRLTIERESAAAITQRRLNAARLLEQFSRPELAVTAYLDAGYSEHAERLVLQVVKQTLAEGRHEQVISWLTAFPDVQLEANPWLTYWLGTAQSYAFNNLSLKTFSEAHHAFSLSENRVGCVMAATSVLNELAQGWISLKGSEVWLDKAHKSYSPDLVFKDINTELVVLTGLLNGHIMLGRAFDHQDAIVKRVMLIQGFATDLNVRLQAASPILRVAEGTWKFEETMAFINEINTIMTDRTVTTSRRAEWLLSSGDFYANAGYMLAQPKYLTLSHAAAAKCKELATEHGLSLYFVPIAISEMKAARNAGDLIAAQQFLMDAEKWMSMTSLQVIANYYQSRTLLSLLRNDPGTALNEIRLAINAAKNGGAYEYFRDVFAINEATCLFRLGEIDGAIACVGDAIRHAPAGRAAIWLTVGMFFKAHRAAWQNHADTHELIADLFSELVRLKHYNAMLYASPEMAWLCADALRRGIAVPFVSEMVQRRGFSPPANADEHWPWQVKIYALGGFSVEIGGIALTTSGKAQKKPIDMLKILATRGGAAYEGIAISTMIDELWPTEKLEDSKASFDTTLHRLRKLIPVDDALRVVDGRIVLNQELVWLDTATFLTFAKRVIADGGNIGDDARLISLYRGALLGHLPGSGAASDSDAIWLAAARERFSSVLINAVKTLANTFEQLGELDAAFAVYEYALQQDNLIEPFYRGKMRIHLLRGEQNEALLVYRRCKELLSLVLGVMPSAETTALRAAIGNPASVAPS